MQKEGMYSYLRYKTKYKLYQYMKIDHVDCLCLNPVIVNFGSLINKAQAMQRYNAKLVSTGNLYYDYLTGSEEGYEVWFNTEEDAKMAVEFLDSLEVIKKLNKPII